jgi:hypothetical protein
MLASRRLKMIERKTDDEGNAVILIGGDKIDPLDYYDGHAVVELDIDALTPLP